MAEYHLSWPAHETTVEDPAEVERMLLDLDQRFDRERRSVLVGVDAMGGSLDLGLGLHHVAMMVTTEEEPGYVTVGPATSDEEVAFEFDGERTPFPVATLIGRDLAFQVLREFLATEQRPTVVAWQEF